jgi:RNA methyltransferase, TrmH family
MELAKLARLHGTALVRKSALLLETVEREIAGLSDAEGAAPEDRDLAEEGLAYAAGLAAFLGSSPEASREAVEAPKAYAAYVPDAESRGRVEALRALNSFRHALRLASGQSTADWDLVDHGRGEGGRGASREGPRRFIPGLRVFLEDIRSPFNVGSILRTAEALGFEEVLLSPESADPTHPRAARSSMGALDLIPWRRCGLAELAFLGPLVALELGGTPIGKYCFPASGVLILGCEELGVSEPALTLAGEGRVSIPMLGVKASINVAVAFGIAAQVWTSSIAADSIQARILR